MLQSVGSQRVRHDCATEHHHITAERALVCLVLATPLWSQGEAEAWLGGLSCPVTWCSPGSQELPPTFSFFDTFLNSRFLGAIFSLKLEHSLGYRGLVGHTRGSGGDASLWVTMDHACVFSHSLTWQLDLLFIFLPT